MTAGEVAVLVVTAGPLAGQRLELVSELLIGREDAGLMIEDAELSRRHALLRLSDQRLQIEDLGSLNGTFVNGARIDAATTLAPADVIRVGRTSIEVESILAGSDRTVLAKPEREVPSAVPAAHRPAADAPVAETPAGDAPVAKAPPSAPAAGSPSAEVPTPAPASVPAPRPPADRPAQAPPAAAFGAAVSARPRRSHSSASRRLTPTLLSFGAIVATAIALVAYFAQH